MPPGTLNADIRGVRDGALVCEPMHPDAEGWSEWIHPLPGYLMQCCDCGLIHQMEFAIGESSDGGPANEGESDDTGVVVFRARRYPPDETPSEDLEPRKIQNGGFSTDAADPEMVKALARRLIRPLRERAKIYGYALASHGTNERDIDLIAVPWTDKAWAPDALVSGLRQVLEKLYPIGLEVGPNTEHPKPHGRICWSWWIKPWTYIDLSIVPPTAAIADTTERVAPPREEP